MPEQSSLFIKDLIAAYTANELWRHNASRGGHLRREVQQRLDGMENTP